MSKAFKLILISTTVSAVALLYFFTDVGTAKYLPRCPFNYLTGLFCPGCGSQRAFAALLHGHLLAAGKFNLLFIVCAPLIIYSALITLINAFSTRQFSQKIFYSPLFVKGLLAIVIFFWVARNLPLYPFYLLAPHS